MIADGSVMEHPKRLDGLRIDDAGDGFIIYQPDRDRVHYLNHTAVLILELCNGQLSPGQIAQVLRTEYGLADTPQLEVDEILTRARLEGLITDASGHEGQSNGSPS